jgi:hypothetical protein
MGLQNNQADNKTSIVQLIARIRAPDRVPGLPPPAPHGMALQGRTSWRTCASRAPVARVRKMLGVPSEPLRQKSGRLTNSAIAGGVDALKTVSAENLSPQEIARLLARPRIDFSSILKTVGPPAAAAPGAIASWPDPEAVS